MVIVDYGLGNLRSVQKSFERIGVNAIISSNREVIADAKKIVLPGVGHFAKGMESLKQSGLIDILNEKVLEQKTPILGICLGMQLMTMHSEEGNCEGLKWVDANTVRFEKDSNKKFKVPHIGWNDTRITQDSVLTKNIQDETQFYFVHTYYVICKSKSNVILDTQYGTRFHSAFQKDNVFGVQFHPEKSYSAGLQLLKNFSELQ
jgi:glutamine amidotransferase